VFGIDAFQSTRPRGARPSAQQQRLLQSVSIHAPAGGATIAAFLCYNLKCFNPRARGGRDLLYCAIGQDFEFQSTRPRGARPRPGAAAQNFAVSIHAPAGGATIRVIACLHCLSFNPRARGGRDLIVLSGTEQPVFQSTRPRGARLMHQAARFLGKVSIHAPAGGATTSLRSPTTTSWFQSTRPRGARRYQKRAARSRFVSIHAPAGGATEKPAVFLIVSCFNPRARGGRDTEVQSGNTYFVFQSTRPRGARQIRR